MNDEQVIRVVQFREGPWLVAQCLEVDITAQGKTESDLLYQLSRLLVGRILASEMLGVDPFTTLPPAPKRYWDMYSEASTLPNKRPPSVPAQVPSRTMATWRVALFPPRSTSKRRPAVSQDA